MKPPSDNDDEMLEKLSNKLVQIASSKKLPSVYKLLHSRCGG